MRRRPLFVTGTDTEVGKTLIASAILRTATQRGLNCLGLKPIAAGCRLEDGEWRNDDALELIAAADSELDYELVNPVALEPAIAPHIALELAGREITVAELAAHCREPDWDGADLVLIEGAGGWLVPLNRHETLADLCVALEADVVLVVGMRLGCLNHALLTAAAIERSGLSLAGWAANCLGETMPFLDQNVATLRDRLSAPCLGVVPYLGSGESETADDHLDLDLLLQ